MVPEFTQLRKVISQTKGALPHAILFISLRLKLILIPLGPPSSNANTLYNNYHILFERLMEKWWFIWKHTLWIKYLYKALSPENAVITEKVWVIREDLK